MLGLAPKDALRIFGSQATAMPLFSLASQGLIIVLLVKMGKINAS